MGVDLLSEIFPEIECCTAQLVGDNRGCAYFWPNGGDAFNHRYIECLINKWQCRKDTVAAMPPASLHGFLAGLQCVVGLKASKG